MEQQYSQGGAAADGLVRDYGDVEGRQGSGLALLMEEWAHGVVVTTVGGRVVHTNGAARRELARRQLIELRNERLHAEDPENAARLQDALLRAAEGKRGLVTLSCEGSPPVTFAVVPLKSPAGEGAFNGGGGVGGVAFIFERASVCDTTMLWFFARGHRLTPAEAQVLGLLCQGHSAPEAAQQLGVAVSTVRSHIRSVCNKTASASVRELVGRVAVLPPVLSAPQGLIH